MTSAHRPWLTAGAGCLLACCGWLGAAQAQSRTAGLELIKGGSTPAAINGMQILNSRACPLLVPAADAELQPLWIPPSQVQAKNRLGCLSAADAIYGPDGCPSKLCGGGKGVIPLPGDITPPAPQPPAP